MPIKPNTCISGNTFIIDTCSAITPTNTFTAATIPSIPQRQYFSDSGTLLYFEGYTSGGTGYNTLLTTSDLWINDSTTNGPLLRSGIWTNFVTTATTTFQPTNTWLGFSVCFNSNSGQTFYVGMGGDNAVSLRLNGNVVIEQKFLPPSVNNFKYWHVYPVELYSGENVLEFLGLNVGSVAGFGFEIYDNIYEELVSATTINDLNVIFSTKNKTGTTFDLVYSSSYVPSTSGYTCESGSTYTYQPCSGRCVTFSSVTINQCSNNTIKNAVEYAWENSSNNIISVGWGNKVVAGVFLNKLCVIYTTPFDFDQSNTLPYQLPPSTFEFDGYTFETCLVQGQTFEGQTNLITPFDYVTCTPSSEGWYNDPPTNQSRIRPLKGGIEFGSPITNKTGTLGALVVDNDTGNLSFLTNAHCVGPLCQFTSERDPSLLVFPPDYQAWCWFSGAPQNQPSTSLSADTIGYVSKFYPLTTYQQNRIDSALITVNESDIDYASSFLQEGLTGWTQPMDFATTSEIDDLINTKPYFYSAGRTTGAKGEGTTKLVLWQSFVTGLKSNTLYGLNGVAQNVSYENQIVLVASSSTTPNNYVCKYPIFFGDSGSVVSADISGSRKIVGQFHTLIITGVADTNPPPGWGGSPCLALVMSRIDDIATLLNVSPWTGQSVNFANINDIRLECNPGLSNSPTLELSGDTYWQIGLCGPENGF